MPSASGAESMSPSSNITTNERAQPTRPSSPRLSQKINHRSDNVRGDETALQRCIPPTFQLTTAEQEVQYRIRCRQRRYTHSRNHGMARRKRMYRRASAKGVVWLREGYHHRRRNALRYAIPAPMKVRRQRKQPRSVERRPVGACSTVGENRTVRFTDSLPLRQARHVHAENHAPPVIQSTMLARRVYR